jgi:hypothetical protein
VRSDAAKKRALHRLAQRAALGVAQAAVSGKVNSLADLMFAAIGGALSGGDARQCVACGAARLDTGDVPDRVCGMCGADLADALPYDARDLERDL